MSKKHSTVQLLGGKWNASWPITKSEWEKRKAELEDIDRTHAVAHDFQRRFIKGQFGTPDAWKYIGYDLMKRVERWAKKYPEEVTIVGCDDAYFAGSTIVLIEHRTEKSYMGTSMYYIPQCTGEAPTQLFLYPWHRTNLIAALRKLGKKRKVSK